MHQPECRRIASSGCSRRAAARAAVRLAASKWTEKVGPEPIGYHHSRIFLRHAANGVFISASGFTDPAIAHAKLALTRMVSVLCELEEIVMVLEREADVRGYFREKVQAAITERRPLHRPVIA
jgi:restriction system protein